MDRNLDSMLRPPSPGTWAKLGATIFAATQPGTDLTAYYHGYYQRELNRLSLGVNKARESLAAETHEDIMNIVSVISAGTCCKKTDIIQQLGPRFAGKTDLSISRSIDLVVRLWLMLNVRDDDLPTLDPQRLSITWSDDDTIQDLVSRQFPPSSAALGLRERRISPGFTAATMVKLCHLQLKWTERLEDHLRLDRKEKTLWIFPYKDFLAAHLHSSQATATRQSPPTSCIYPRQFLRETIMTINVLFPQWDPNTELLLAKNKQTFDSMGPFFTARRLDFHEFSYWRDQLFELYEEVYLAPADSWRQLWVDRRNPYQWYTFWIALIVFFMSLASLILTSIQTWASVTALKA